MLQQRISLIPSHVNLSNTVLGALERVLGWKCRLPTRHISPLPLCSQRSREGGPSNKEHRSGQMTRPQRTPSAPGRSYFPVPTRRDVRKYPAVPHSRLPRYRKCRTGTSQDILEGYAGHELETLSLLETQLEILLLRES